MGAGLCEGEVLCGGQVCVLGSGVFAKAAEARRLKTKEDKVIVCACVCVLFSLFQWSGDGR